MRRILVENARRKRFAKHGGGRKRVDLADADPGYLADNDEILAVDDALNQLAAEDPQAARLVQLRYFGGLSIEEAAKLLGIARSTAYEHWAYARASLRLILGTDADARTPSSIGRFVGGSISQAATGTLPTLDPSVLGALLVGGASSNSLVWEVSITPQWLGVPATDRLVLSNPQAIPPEWTAITLHHERAKHGTYYLAANPLNEAVLEQGQLSVLEAAS
jgi:hypothetical protein